MIDFVEIFKNDNIIGCIGQEPNSKIHINAKKGFDKVLKSFVSPVKVDLAYIEGDTSISESVVIMLDNPKWISYLEYGIPPEYLTSSIKTKELKDFLEM